MRRCQGVSMRESRLVKDGRACQWPRGCGDYVCIQYVSCYLQGGYAQPLGHRQRRRLVDLRLFLLLLKLAEAPQICWPSGRWNSLAENAAARASSCRPPPSSQLDRTPSEVAAAAPSPNMASEDHTYHPKDAIAATVRTTMITGAAGTIVSGIQNTLTKQNVGAMGVLTRTGGTIAVFGM